jgi:thiamine biosynthesis protein ThiS
MAQNAKKGECMPITIHVNGKTRSLDERTSLTDLLVRLKISENGIAVERNRQIVGKDLLNSVTLEDGDKVEIIRIVSGG